jgi:peptidyl-tRNA hydrolase
MSYIHYIIVRRDLKFSKGKKLIHTTGVGSTLGTTAAQVTHAAGESFAAFTRDSHKRLGRHIEPAGTIAVVLGVPSESALRAWEKKLLRYRVQHVAIREPDAPWNGQLMAIGLWPVERRPTFTLLRRLKLL